MQLPAGSVRGLAGEASSIVTGISDEEFDRQAMAVSPTTRRRKMSRFPDRSGRGYDGDGAVDPAEGLRPRHRGTDRELHGG